MKFTLHFKTPHAMDVLESIFPEPDLLESDQDEEAFEQAWAEREAALALVQKFVEYGECVSIEFDLESETCRVLGRVLERH